MRIIILFVLTIVSHFIGLTADFCDLPYGKHERQRMNVHHVCAVGAPRPVLVFIHGGGWKGGCRTENPAPWLSELCRKRGFAFVSIDYRYLEDGRREGIFPPVRAPLDDVETALRFIVSHAREWNIDKQRIGLTGGSAGACSALIVALKDDNDLGVVAVGTRYPQTSLDPAEMRRWIPNISYGAEAFGYSSFDEWLAHRSDVLRWIEHYSPILLLKKCRSDRAPKFFMDSYSLEKEGPLPNDPTHAGMFREKFREACRALGYEARDFAGDDYYDALLDCISGGREHLQRVKRASGNGIIRQKEERTK